jgi:hypothetical protein
MSKLIAKLKSSVLTGKIKDIPRVDNTLTKEGWAAEAKVTGEKIAEVVAEAKDAGEKFEKKFAEIVEELSKDYREVNGVTEWIYPPMEVGVEYRLAERYMGKPVYIKAVNYGFKSPHNHGAENIDKIIDCGGSTFDGEWKFSIPYYETSGKNIKLGVTETEIIVLIDSNLQLELPHLRENAVVWLKYTKTTD